MRILFCGAKRIVILVQSAVRRLRDQNLEACQTSNACHPVRVTREVPLESSFGNLMSADQQQEILALQLHARGAGLAGTVVPVWDSGGGRMAFIAPTQFNLGLQ